MQDDSSITIQMCVSVPLKKKKRASWPPLHGRTLEQECMIAIVQEPCKYIQEESVEWINTKKDPIWAVFSCEAS